MRIFLIGFMGAGKTTIGKALANALNIEFYDLDEEIEKSFKISIPTIFKTFGEECFRKLEMQTLKHFESLDNFVLSCGGGTPCFAENMNFINNSGISIYIKLPAKALASRIEASHKKRPLTTNKTHEELLQYIDETLAQRECFYNQAQLVVNGINFDKKKLVEEIKILLTNSSL